MSFRTKTRRDDKYIRLMKMVASIESKIDSRQLVKDMRTMLVARKYRKIDVSILHQATHDLTEWVGELISYRARLADIRFLVLDQKLTLEGATKAVHKHLLSEYRGEMATIKGVAERKAFVEDVLDEPLQLIGKLDKLLKLSDEVLAELESSFKGNTSIKHVFEISTRPERA